MTAPYKKRAKGNWRQGKRYKGDAEERSHEYKEIETELDLDTTGLTRHRPKRKKNRRAILQHRIAWYERTIEYWERENKRGYCSHISSLREGLREAQKEYEEKYGQKS